MASDYEQKRYKYIIDYINQLKEMYGDKVFPFEMTQNTVNLEKMFCNSKLCSSCGECCATAPCIFSPYDFLDIQNMEYMKNILNTGFLCISVSPNDDKTLILRPRGRKDTTSIYSWTSSSHNHCILENGEGCMLPVQYRPFQGLMQIPYVRNGFLFHKNLYSDDDLEYDYKPFQQLLKTLMYEYNSLPIPNYNNHNDMEESVKSLIKSLKKSSKN